MSVCEFCGNQADASWACDWYIPHKFCSDSCFTNGCEGIGNPCKRCKSADDLKEARNKIDELTFERDEARGLYRTSIKEANGLREENVKLIKCIESECQDRADVIRIRRAFEKR